eukprot:m.46289 g.46289  ORF g.46289 m.46289 type:complete len:823 (+) comp7260_c0_seq1:89-2557(+)
MDEESSLLFNWESHGKWLLKMVDVQKAKPPQSPQQEQPQPHVSVVLKVDEEALNMWWEMTMHQYALSQEKSPCFIEALHWFRVLISRDNEDKWVIYLREVEPLSMLVDFLDMCLEDAPELWEALMPLGDEMLTVLSIAGHDWPQRLLQTANFPLLFRCLSLRTKFQSKHSMPTPQLDIAIYSKAMRQIVNEVGRDGEVDVLVTRMRNFPRVPVLVVSSLLSEMENETTTVHFLDATAIRMLRLYLKIDSDFVLNCLTYENPNAGWFLVANMIRNNNSMNNNANVTGSSSSSSDGEDIINAYSLLEKLTKGCSRYLSERTTHRPFSLPSCHYDVDWEVDLFLCALVQDDRISPTMLATLLAYQHPRDFNKIAPFLAISLKSTPSWVAKCTSILQHLFLLNFKRASAILFFVFDRHDHHHDQQLHPPCMTTMDTRVDEDVGNCILYLDLSKTLHKSNIHIPLEQVHSLERTRRWLQQRISAIFQQLSTLEATPCSWQYTLGWLWFHNWVLCTLPIVSTLSMEPTFHLIQKMTTQFAHNKEFREELLLFFKMIIKHYPMEMVGIFWRLVQTNLDSSSNNGDSQNLDERVIQEVFIWRERIFQLLLQAPECVNALVPIFCQDIKYPKPHHIKKNQEPSRYEIEVQRKFEATPTFFRLVGISIVWGDSLKGDLTLVRALTVAYIRKCARTMSLKKTRVNPLTLQFCFKFLVPVLRNTCGDILLTRIACMFSSNTLPSTLHSWLEDCLREFDKVFHEERPIDITEDTNIPNENGNDTLDDSDSDAGDEDESSAIKIPTSALQEMEQSSDNLRLLPFIIQGCKISKKDF